MTQRRIAVAIPACDEAASIGAAIDSLLRADLDARVRGVKILVLANNCRDDTVPIARGFIARGAPVEVVEVTLEPARAHAGWARRLALDAAAAGLRPCDVLASTDADTVVDRAWIVRTLDHLDAGFDAVAGLARLAPSELRSLPTETRRRFAAIRGYEDAASFIRAAQDGTEPWPRHYYEGGASLAVRQGAYRAIGGAPTPPVGEDKALFERLRAAGFRVRHPRDVRVHTSCRFAGRASRGAADTLALWARQGADAPLELTRLARPSRPSEAEPLSFRSLEREARRIRALVRSLRAASGLDLAL